MNERRKHPRADIPVGISYHILKALSGTSVKTKNISAGGICIPSILNCTPNVMVELRLFLRSKVAPIPLIGEIVWVKESPENRMMFNVGVKFVALNDDQQKCIADYLHEMKGSKK